MPDLLVEVDRLLEQALLAVDPDAGVAVAAQLLEQILELALARPRTIGASTVNRVPSGNASTWSTICSADWPVIGLPHTGQWGWPIRAYSSRR